MRRYLIATVVVIICFLGSVIYREQTIRVFSHFPVHEAPGSSTEEARLNLFLVFSKKNCATCLIDIVRVLNGLAAPFYVIGIVPNDELENEQEFRRITGAVFPLYSFKKYRRYIPLYTPTLIGVSPAGEVVFVLPGTALHKRHINSFLETAYNNLYPLLGKKKDTTK